MKSDILPHRADSLCVLQQPVSYCGQPVRILQNNITTLCEQNKILNVIADDTHNYHWTVMIKSKWVDQWLWNLKYV
jgi:hypothetical protein